MDASTGEPLWSVTAMEELPAWTLVRAYHVLAREITELFAELGLTPTQFGVLAQLGSGPPLLQSEIARRVLVRPQSVSELLTPLLDDGLVERLGPAGRGRRSGVAITAAGRQRLTVALPRLYAFNEPAALGLSPGQATNLNRLLHALLDSRNVGAGGTGSA